MRSTARASFGKRMLPKGSAAALLLLLLAFARLAGASSISGDGLAPMNPPIVKDDDPNTPVTLEWPNEGTWPLSDESEADYMDSPQEGSSEYVLASDTPMVDTEDELLAEAHRKLAGVDDVFEDINDWFKGVGRNIRRRILQAPATPAPAPKAPAPTPAPAPKAPTPAPKAPTPAPAPPPAPTPGPKTPSTPTQPTTPTTPTPGTSTPPTTATGATTPTTDSVTTDAATSTGEVTTKPAANPDEAVTPEAIKPDEKVPEAVQQQQDAALKAQQDAAAQATAGQIVQASVPADIVSVAFRVEDMDPDMFNSFHLANTLTTLARLTGTPADQWKATLAAKTSTRALLQTSTTTPTPSGSFLAVSLSILTRNPQLVVYRLAQAPLSTASGSGCSSELCARLIAAGVPVVPDTVVITPDYSSVYQFGTPAVRKADEKLANAQRTGAIVGACVGGGVVLILLLFTYKKIINCFRGQFNAMKAKKQAKNATATATKPQETQLPKSLDPVGPKAEPPVKFLSLSGSGGLSSNAQEAYPHNTSIYKQGSSSSSGIPVGPATGPSHSVMPWAEGDESAYHGDQDGKFLPVPPTAASLAGLAHQQKQQQMGGLYRDSNSFRQWAASAVAQGPNTPNHTPSSSVADVPTSKANKRVPQLVSPATAANLAAAMPGSPISSPMYATPAVGSPRKTSATVDVMRLQQMLDAYHLERDQELTPAASPAARAHTVTGASGRAGAGVAAPAGVVSMVNATAPASPLAAAGWSGSGAAAAPTRPVRSAVYPSRRTSTPGSPHAGMSYSTLRAASSPGQNNTAAAEPADRQFFFSTSTRR